MSIEQYLNDYSPLKSHLPGDSLPWLQAIRQEAFAAFTERGFPSLREEDWRYTKLTALDKTVFQSVQDMAVDLEWLGDIRLPDAYHLVMVNGNFCPEASDSLPAELNCCSLRQALVQQPDQVAEYLGKALPEAEHSLISFNSAWFSDGIWLEASQSLVLDKPIQILHIVTSAQALAAAANIIIVNPHS